MTGGKTQVIATIEKVQNFNRKQKRDVLTTCQGHWRSKKAWTQKRMPQIQQNGKVGNCIINIITYINIRTIRRVLTIQESNIH
jgi:hypothetical protein